jgi:hypothetical protein
MSTLMLASARGPKMAGRDARAIRHAGDGDLGLVLGEGDAAHD